MRGGMGGAAKISSLLLARSKFSRRSIFLLRNMACIRVNSILSNTNTQHSLFSLFLHPWRRFSSETENPLHMHWETRIPNDDPVLRLPEWLKFVDYLAGCGYTRQIGEGLSSELVGMPEEFRKTAASCLYFARERPDVLRSISLGRVKALVENGSPFLFKDEMECVRRMNSYVGHQNSDMTPSEQACTTDLMKYLVSYAWKFVNLTGGSNGESGDIIEISFRGVLDEIVKISNGSLQPDPTESSARHARIGSEDPQKSWQQSIEMKKGDWFCPKCNFMNFARNVQCRGCNEARLKKELTGGDWECPQCDFFNYARNLKCLRCDCKRPEGTQPSQSQSQVLDHILHSGSVNKAEIERKLAENDEKAERWFSKISQLDDTSDLNAAIADEDFPEIMPLRKGMNRFVVSTRKTPLERKLANAQYMGNDKMTGSAITQTLERILSPSTSTSPAVSNYLSSEKTTQHEANKTMPRESSPGRTGFSTNLIAAEIKTENQFAISREEGHSVVAPPYKRRIAIDQANNPNFIPFVPFPPDYFAKSGIKEGGLNEQNQSLSSRDRDQPREIPERANRMNTHRWSNSETVGQSDQSQSRRPDYRDPPREMQQRVANRMSSHGLYNNESIGQSEGGQSLRPKEWNTPQEMQQRFNGMNNHELSNNQHIGQLGQSQSQRSRDWDPHQGMQQRTNRVSTLGLPNNITAGHGEQSQSLRQKDWDPHREMPQNVNGMSSHRLYNNHTAAVTGQSSSHRSRDWDPNQEMQQRVNGMSSYGHYNKETTGFAGQSQNLRPTYGDLTRETQQRVNGMSSHGLSAGQTVGQTSQSQRSVDGASSYGFGGKSLEGSAVTDPDPLDMSEEAKTQRWFRRVAQIKDISELSNIPDEDFPEIMPLRKGVNRFVVSKRKTPMERRLTSPQYKRNLPIMNSSNPEKDPTRE
ncbi:zinc finger protein VAR3, chloroplastic-like [Wolffia australiana]